MLKLLKTTAQCAIQNVRRSFTLHFNGKHKLNLSEVRKYPEKCHRLKCECGEEFNYVPYSDHGKDNVGAILDKYGSVRQYFKH